MLELTIPTVEQWDERTSKFVYTKGQTIVLEHSLVSISKWEAKYCKAFLTKKDKTVAEMMDYIKAMTITQNVNPELYNHLTKEHMEEIKDYIGSPMTATHFYDDKNIGGGFSREQITAELVYYWMISLHIPMEFQKWHFNRLQALIKVCSIKNQTPQKRSRQEMLRRNTALNEARRKQLNTKG